MIKTNLGSLVIISIIFIVTLAMSSCDQTVPQQVIVNVASWEGAPKLLRLYGRVKCNGPYKEQARSTDLTFTFDTESTRGGVGVVTQDLALCYQAGSIWLPLWSSRHGGGAIRIVVECNATALCTDEFFYR